VFGDGGQTRDFIFVKDIAQVNLAALRISSKGFCNIGTGRSVSLLELIAVLAECVGRAPEIHYDPPQAGDIRNSAMAPTQMREWFGITEPTPLASGLRALIAAGR